MNQRHIFRLWTFVLLFIAISLVFLARLINVQIADTDYYAHVSTDTYTRTVKIQAQRGEVYDCNGTALIKNKYSYSIQLDRGTLSYSNDEMNQNLLDIYEKINEADAEYELSTITFPGTGTYPEYEMDEEFFENSQNKYRFVRFLSMLGIDDIGTITDGVVYPYSLSYFGKYLSSESFKKALYSLKSETDAPSSVSISDIAAQLAERYGLVDKNGEELYDRETADFLLRLRYDMESRDFSSANPYTVATNADISLITYLEEGSLRGFSVYVSSERVYCEPGVASHILGRTGKIQAADVDYFTSLGYRLDAIVGVDGVEKAFEEYLHGVDGEMIITEDEYGNIIDQKISKEPVAGYDVYLTIDIELQKRAEQALIDNINYIHSQAEKSGSELSGEDANAGAITVLDVKTNAVKAIASYPTYNLATYRQDVGELNTDETKPLYNRALNGTYPPGSTFKPAVAIAALSEGIVKEDTVIETLGRYDYYIESGYTPRCWLYVSKGKSHGKINISEAIKVSCNYFFYELGRLLTIEKMNEYCRVLGLGESTGIELSEKTGTLAGPDYRTEHGLDAWNPGDTLAAAIGQSDNLFTPLQLSVYMSSLINCGVRYNAHILDCVKKYGTNEIVYSTPKEVLSETEISEDDVNVVLAAMQTVVESGTTATLFDNYPIKVGGKTGTAQVAKNQSDNAVFVGFAPFNDPQIVATCVIERGAKGAWAGMAVRDVFTEYFDLTPTSSEDGGDEGDIDGDVEIDQNDNGADE